MIKNKKLQIRLPEELLEYLKKATNNISLYIRNLIQEKVDNNQKSEPQPLALAPRTPYLYYAKLFKVIDGDTLLLDVDVGFFMNIKIKVRLAGVNAPPLSTPEGIKAKEFVENELTNCQLIIETRKKEKYGRYLAYIYYHKEFTKFEDIIRGGKLLNDELINKGFSDIYQ